MDVDNIFNDAFLMLFKNNYQNNMKILIEYIPARNDRLKA